MESDLVTLVIQTAKSPEVITQPDSSVVVAYQLPKPLFFSTNYFARVALWDRTGGYTANCLILTDFTKEQPVNGELLGYLGSTNSIATNEYVPLASNYIPAFGRITFVPYPNSKLPTAKANQTIKGTLIIQLVPEKFVHQAFL